MGSHNGRMKTRMERIRSSNCFIYVVINAAVFTDAYLYGLIVPILPFALRTIVHLREDAIQAWTGILLGGYGAGVLIGSLVVGYLADSSTSRKAPYLFGLVAVAASTVMFSLGCSTMILLFGRILQGASTASVHSVGTAILADTVGEGKIGPLMGIVDMSMALGSILGPVAGGSLYHYVGYAAVFESAYILIAIDLVLRLLMREKQRKPGMKSEDRRNSQGNPSGSFYDGETSSQGSCSDPESLETDPLWIADSGYGSTGPSTPAASPGNASNPHLRSAPSPSLPPTPQPPNPHHPMLTLLTMPRMLAALLADFAQSVLLTALESTLPLHLKRLFNYDTQRIGLLFLALCIPSFLAPAVGYFSDRIGARFVVAAGFLDLAVSMALLAVVDDVQNQYREVVLCVLLLLVGLGLNMVLTPVFADVTYMVEREGAARDEDVGGSGEGKRAYGQAFALLGVAHASGSLLGPVTGGFVVERAGWKCWMVWSGVACAVCAGPTGWWLGGRVR